jgi:hypothetical protein
MLAGATEIGVSGSDGGSDGGSFTPPTTGGEVRGEVG